MLLPSAHCEIWGRGIADRGIRAGDTVPVNIKLRDSLLTVDPGLFAVVVKNKGTSASFKTKYGIYCGVRKSQQIA